MSVSMGERLRQLRLRRGESLGKASLAIGCSKPYLWELERESQDNPSLKVLRAIARHYGVMIADIVEE
jgi:transcriptional regulator with XRE-family HTH domain